MPKINDFQDFEVAYADMSRYVKSKPLENLSEKKIRSFVRNSLLTFMSDEKVEKKIQEFSQKLRVLTNNKPYVTRLLKWETQTINGTIYPVCFTYTKSQQDIADKLTSLVDALIWKHQYWTHIASMMKDNQQNVVQNPKTKLKKRKSDKISKADSLAFNALMLSKIPPTIERFEQLRKGASRSWQWGAF